MLYALPFIRVPVGAQAPVVMENGKDVITIHGFLKGDGLFEFICLDQVVQNKLLWSETAVIMGTKI